MNYRGRFAPTPSGPLHRGSLMTALASFLQARTAGGKWLLRIDDLDRERCPAGATGIILRQLEAHGLFWDEPPRLQSEHIDSYAAAFTDLSARARVYTCTCTRNALARTSLSGIDGPVYAGRCAGTTATAGTGALRLSVGSGSMAIEDACLGVLQRDLARDVGDFVIRRADDQFAYQLACVVDEAAQGITEVVRGVDLLGSSFRQRRLQTLLTIPTTGFVHLPLLVDEHGRKLSKQNHARPATAETASDTLMRCLHDLGQSPPNALRTSSVGEVLKWATNSWRLDRIPRQAPVSANENRARGEAW